MEDMWKKFKEETRQDMENVKEFLRQASANPMIPEPSMFQPKPLEKIDPRISSQVVLEDEKSQTLISQIQDCAQDPLDVSKKKAYGSLAEMVRQLMEKENVSRAQAYRRAKKIVSEKSQ
jgi:hypothetical protein